MEDNPEIPDEDFKKILNQSGGKRKKKSKDSVSKSKKSKSKKPKSKKSKSRSKKSKQKAGSVKSIKRLKIVKRSKSMKAKRPMNNYMSLLNEIRKYYGSVTNKKGGKDVIIEINKILKESLKKLKMEKVTEENMKELLDIAKKEIDKKH